MLTEMSKRMTVVSIKNNILKIYIYIFFETRKETMSKQQHAHMLAQIRSTLQMH